MRLEIAALILISSGPLWAVPSISSVSGTVADGQALTISGSGFGAKPGCPGDDCKPKYFSRFTLDNDTCDPNPDSTYGTNSAWGSISKMSTSTVDNLMGTCSMRGSSTNSSTTGLEANINMVQGSASMFFWVMRTTATNATGDNIKLMRLHDSGATYTNAIPLTHAVFNDHRFAFEYGDGGSLISAPARNISYKHLAQNINQWVPYEFDYLIQTATQSENGSWRLQQQGYSIDVTSANVTFDIGDSLQEFDQQYMMWNISNSTETVDGDVQIGYVFVDSGTVSGNYVSRVYVSTVNSFGGGSMYPQPYSAWSDTSITLSRLTVPDSYSGNTFYAYICDEDDNCTSAFDLSQSVSSVTGSIPQGTYTVEGGVAFQ